MAKYRNKPVVIEATQWFRNGDHPEDNCGLYKDTDNPSIVHQVEGKVVRYYRHPKIDGDYVCLFCNTRMHEHGWIDFGVGSGKIVCPGDYIITELVGYTACKPDVFNQNYELAE